MGAQTPLPCREPESRAHQLPAAVGQCSTGAEPLTAAETLLYRTDKSERAQYPFQKDINRKKMPYILQKQQLAFFLLWFFFYFIFQTKLDLSIRMLYSSLAKRFPVPSDNSSLMVPNQPAINNPQEHHRVSHPPPPLHACILPLCLPHAALLPCLGQHAPLCLSWVSKYNRPSETEKALPRHARLAPAAALTNPAGKGK